MKLLVEQLVHQIIKQVILWLQIYIYIIWFKFFWNNEISISYRSPHVHAAHASSTVKENKALYYGGSIGNRQYVNKWFTIFRYKKKEEANWMQMPIEESHT